MLEKRATRSEAASRRLRFALALAAALLFVQTLGSVHRIAHFAQQQQRGDAGAPLASPFVTPAGSLQALFDGHQEARDCERFDQLSHGDVAFGDTPQGQAETPTSISADAHPASHIAAQALGFLARAPPSVS